jgi:hypothetical protein
MLAAFRLRDDGCIVMWSKPVLHRHPHAMERRQPRSVSLRRHAAQPNGMRKELHHVLMALGRDFHEERPQLTIMNMIGGPLEPAGGISASHNQLIQDDSFVSLRHHILPSTEGAIARPSTHPGASHVSGDRVGKFALATVTALGTWVFFRTSRESSGRSADATAWIVISGVGGLGHVAIQYAKAMGLHVVAVDVTNETLILARALGAETAVNGGLPGAVDEVVKAQEAAPRRACDRGVDTCLRSSLAHGSSQGNGQPRRTATQ